MPLSALPDAGESSKQPSWHTINRCSLSEIALSSNIAGQRNCSKRIASYPIQRAERLANRKGVFPHYSSPPRSIPAQQLCLFRAPSMQELQGLPGTQQSLGRPPTGRARARAWHRQRSHAVCFARTPEACQGAELELGTLPAVHIQPGHDAWRATGECGLACPVGSGTFSHKHGPNRSMPASLTPATDPCAALTPDGLPLVTRSTSAQGCGGYRAKSGRSPACTLLLWHAMMPYTHDHNTDSSCCCPWL